MVVERVPTDVVADDLVRTYAAATRRLERLVEDAIRRGLDPDRVGGIDQRRGDATALYRRRQLAAAKAILAELRAGGGRAAAEVAHRAYASALLAVDRTVADGARLAGRFGGIHAGAVDVLAANMAGSIDAAADRLGHNLDLVFARMDALEGGLEPGGFPFVGRRVDDPYRRVALDTLGEGLVTLSTRRQVSAELVRRLIRDGVTDATTGFVDRAGRRWTLDRYAEMVARTTTREATSRATVNRLEDHDLALVTISSHPHPHDVCSEYEGRTWALPGHPDERYPELPLLPPFHPYCRHVLTPAGVSFEDFERELGLAAEGAPSTVQTPGAPDGAAAPPFGAQARPSTARGTELRKAEQDLAYLLESDPGPDPDVVEARWQAIEAAERRAKRAARKRERDAERVLDDALGPDVVEALADFRASGVKWATDRDLKAALVNGEADVDDVIYQAERELAELEERRLTREEIAAEAGYKRRAIPCFVCGRFKRRPADICDYCGDEPGTYHGNAHDLNEAYGYRRG